MNLPEGWTAGTVDANGIDLQYYRAGDGPPIVLAHGFYDDGRCWIPLAEDLRADYEVVAYDARGHGRSDAPETGYSLDDRVADLVGLVDGLDLANPILLGHSMGGATAAWTAANHPDLPRGLVLEDPEGIHGTPEMDPDEMAGIVRQKLRERRDRTVEEEVEATLEETPGFDRECARRSAEADGRCSPNAAEIAREGYPEPLSAAFESIECPTLVLRHDADTERRVADLDAAETLDDGRIVHVPDAGHYVFATAYDAALAELRPFLERT